MSLQNVTSKLWTELKESLVKIGIAFFLAHSLEINVYFKCKMIWLKHDCVMKYAYYISVSIF